MSAFIVSNKTLDNTTILVAKSLDRAVIEENKDYLTGLKNKLNALNIESVNFRYDETSEISPVEFNDISNTESIEQLLKSYRCWHYQSCEKDSMSFDIIEKLVRNYEDTNLIGMSNTKAYDKAEWDY